MTEKLLDLILKPISNKSYNQIDKILVYLLSLWSQPWVTIEYIINYIFFFVIRSRSSTIFQIQYNSEDDDNAQCPLRPLSSVAIYCHEYKSFYNFFSFQKGHFKRQKKSNDGCQMLNWKPYYSTYLLGLLITREFATTYIHSVLTTILSVITLLNLTMTVNCEATTATKNVVQTEQTAK